MKVVGITGGIGSGKTTVCRIFEQLGVPVYYADLRAKEVMTTNDRLRQAIIAEFGDSAYSNDGLNRSYLAEQVFGSPEKLAVLNGLVHPAVASDFKDWVKQQKGAYVLKEAAILFESGGNKDVNSVLLVTAPEQLRLERVIARDNSSKEDVMLRMNNQWSEERKVKLSDHVIVNDGQTLLIPQVLELHRKFNGK